MRGTRTKPVGETLTRGRRPSRLSLKLDAQEPRLELVGELREVVQVERAPVRPRQRSLPLPAPPRRSDNLYVPVAGDQLPAACAAFAASGLSVASLSDVPACCSS